MVLLKPCLTRLEVLVELEALGTLFGELVMKLSKDRPHLVGIPSSVGR